MGLLNITWQSHVPELDLVLQLTGDWNLLERFLSNWQGYIRIPRLFNKYLNVRSLPWQPPPPLPRPHFNKRFHELISIPQPLLISILKWPGAAILAAQKLTKSVSYWHCHQSRETNFNCLAKDAFLFASQQPLQPIHSNRSCPSSRSVIQSKRAPFSILHPPHLSDMGAFCFGNTWLALILM